MQEKEYLEQHTKQKKNRRSSNINALGAKGGFSLNNLQGKMQAGLVDKSKVSFMETKYKNDAMVEGIISMWKITSAG